MDIMPVSAERYGLVRKGAAHYHVCCSVCHNKIDLASGTATSVENVASTCS